MRARLSGVAGTVGQWWRRIEGFARYWLGHFMERDLIALNSGQHPPEGDLGAAFRAWREYLGQTEHELATCLRRHFPHAGDANALAQVIRTIEHESRWPLSVQHAPSFVTACQRCMPRNQTAKVYTAIFGALLIVQANGLPPGSADPFRRHV